MIDIRLIWDCDTSINGLYLATSTSHAQGFTGGVEHDGKVREESGRLGREEIAPRALVHASYLPGAVDSVSQRVIASSRVCGNEFCMSPVTVKVDAAGDVSPRTLD